MPMERLCNTKVINKLKLSLFVEMPTELRSLDFKNPYYTNTLDWLRQKGYEVYHCTEEMKLGKMDRNYPFNHIAMYLCVGEYQQRAMSFVNASIDSGNLLQLPLQLAKEPPKLSDQIKQMTISSRLKRSLRIFSRKHIL